MPTHSPWLLPLLFTGVLMGALDLAIIGPALPAIRAEFGMNDRQLSVLFNAYVLCQMIGTPLFGKLADRVGARLGYVAGVGLFGAGSLLLVLSTSPEMLYAGRALQGLGGGGIFPVAAAVIATGLPREERGSALGILGTVFGLAFIIGPVMGGLLLPYGWHWLFLVNLPIAAVLIVGALKLLPTAPRPASQPIDMGGIATLSVGMTALVFALSTFDLQAPASYAPAGVALALAAGLLAAFWRIEQRAADPLIRPGLFRSRPIVKAGVLSTAVGAIQAAGTFYPAFAVLALGVADSTAAWLMLPGVVVATVASPLVGRMTRTVSLRAILVAGFILVGVSVAMYGLLPMSLPIFIAASLIGNAGMGGVLGAPLRLIVMNHSGPGESGAAQGLLSNASSVGRLVGAAFTGGIAAAVGTGAAGYQAAFVGMTVVAIAATALALTLAHERPASTAGKDLQRAA
jgi:MFS family permease